MAKQKQTTDPRIIRLGLGLNQTEFWSKLGVTQSGGSRYESGRSMPKPVQELLRLVHIEKIDIKSIKGEDVILINFLKENDPELLASLQKAVKTAKTNAKR